MIDPKDIPDRQPQIPAGSVNSSNPTMKQATRRKVGRFDLFSSGSRRRVITTYFLANVKVHTSATGGEPSTQVEGCSYAGKSNSERVADCGVTPCSALVNYFAWGFIGFTLISPKLSFNTFSVDSYKSFGKTVPRSPDDE